MRQYLLIFLFLPSWGYAQNNVWVGGKVLNPDSTIRTQPTRSLASGRILKPDREGNFYESFSLERPKQISFYANLYSFSVFLSPNDSIYVSNIQTKNLTIDYSYSNMRYTKILNTTKPNFEGRGAKINQFLYNNALLGRDSVAEKAIFKNLAEEQYFNFIDDLSAGIWQQYQSTQDTTNHHQNTFVLASVRAQNYFRKLGFHIQGSGRINEQSLGTVDLRLLQDDEARNVPSYMEALRNYFQIYTIRYDDRWEDKEQRIVETFKKLPKTREALVYENIDASLFFARINDELPQLEARIKRFANEYPDSDKIPQLLNQIWEAKASQPYQIGKEFPITPFLTATKDTVTLAKFKGKPTTILFWNTWCDSCKTAIQKFYQQAAAQKNNSSNMIVICVNNSQETWESALKNLPQLPQIQHLYVLRKHESLIRSVMMKNNFPENATLLFLDADGKVKSPPENF